MPGRSRSAPYCARVNLHGVLHLLGIDTQASYFYDFWSGVGTQLTLLLAAVGSFHKHNCHARRCPRIGKHTVNGTPWCTAHMPEAPAPS